MVNTVYLHPGFVIQPLIINIVDLKMHKWITLLDVNELVPHWTFTFTSNMVKNSQELNRKELFCMKCIVA